MVFLRVEIINLTTLCKLGTGEADPFVSCVEHSIVTMEEVKAKNPVFDKRTLHNSEATESLFCFSISEH